MIFFQRKANFSERWKVCTHYYTAVTVCAFLVELPVHRMAEGQCGCGRKAPLEIIQSVHKGLKRTACSVSCPVKFWISSDDMKERNIFSRIYALLECHLSWQPPSFFHWPFQMVKLSVFIHSIFMLGVPSFNTVFSGRGTCKKLLINISCTEQIFAYRMQLPAGLCFDFGINLELVSWNILEHPNQN